MCENCLYRNNCQFIATHKNYKTVTGCTAFRSEQQIKSDAARQIFEEIEKLISSECLVIKDEAGIRGYVDASVHYILAELKKKYTESENINENR